jgi:CheY-like chemotaxis protein
MRSQAAPVLVAEDEDSDVILLRHAFKSLHIPNPLVAVKDGTEVLDYLQGKKPFDNRAEHPAPALLLLDLKMARMSGFDVLEWLQDHPDLKTFPVVVLTSSDSAIDRQKARSLGASQYCVKPSGVQKLTELMRELHDRWIRK